jgi:hypothetical protein
MDFTGDIEEDCILLYNILDYELAGSKSGTARKQMFKKGHGKNETTDSYSITMGHTFRSYMSPKKNRENSEIFKGLYKTKLLTEKPHLVDVITEFGSHHFPDFAFTEIQFNYNWASPPHFDKANLGDSLIIGLGDYSCGELVIEQPDKSIIKVDIHDKPYIFNGAKFKHWTDAYTGNRLSMVLYSLKKEKI